MMAVVDADGVLDVSRETRARLDVYAETLTRWNAKINLVSGATLKTLWTRHIADSAQLLDLAPPDARAWVDLGSGAGLPALVVAAVAAETRPGLRVTAIESDHRKCAFMAEAARRMGATLDIRAGRIEGATPVPADVVSARALAPLPQLLALAAPFYAGVGLFPKGARYGEELMAAARDWRFDHRVWPSRTDPKTAILEIRRPRRVRE